MTGDVANAFVADAITMAAEANSPDLIMLHPSGCGGREPHIVRQS